MYPEDSLQGVIPVDHWWVDDPEENFCQGRLVNFFGLHIHQHPAVLIPKGREEPTEHKTALFEFRPLDIRSVIRYPDLPVAGIPGYRNEVRAVYRAKRRPGLIICAGGPGIPKNLTRGKPKWQSNPAILVAPYYGVDEDGRRAGFNPEFIKRVQRCEYPQFMWDRLPLSGKTTESIMRLDHMQPVARNQDSVELLPYRLSDDALLFFQEWLDWLLTGLLEKGSLFYEAREGLLTNG